VDHSEPRKALMLGASNLLTKFRKCKL